MNGKNWQCLSCGREFEEPRQLCVDGCDGWVDGKADLGPMTYSNVNLGGLAGDRTITKRVPFMVDGIAAQQISDSVWAYQLLPTQRRVDITELPPPKR